MTSIERAKQIGEQLKIINEASEKLHTRDQEIEEIVDPLKEEQSQNREQRRAMQSDVNALHNEQLICPRCDGRVRYKWFEGHLKGHKVVIE